MKKLVIFDLDGTLLDTVADLAAAVNFALVEYRYPTHEVSAYKFFIGNGINKLFERALPPGENTPDNILKIRQLFLGYYGAHGSELTVPYPGIPELLRQLQDAGMQLAVASNKYQAGTEELVRHFFPGIGFTAIFGQRDNVPIKPDPTILYDILRIANVEKDEAIYVGDSGVDMQTANQAGVEAIGVLWGFRPRVELAAFEPAYIVNEPGEIPHILQLDQN